MTYGEVFVPVLLTPCNIHSNVKFKQQQSVYRAQWYLAEVDPYIATPFEIMMTNECNTRLCQMYDVRKYSETATACSSQQTEAWGIWCPGKTKSQARGLGCCLAPLSTAFNMTEHNSDSDHIDRKLLTMSGEKVICQLFHCGMYDCHACNGLEVVTWLKNTERISRKSLLKFSVLKNLTYITDNNKNNLSDVYDLFIILTYSVH